MAPQRVTHRSTSSVAAAGSATECPLAAPVPPDARISSATRSLAASSMSLTTTAAPERAACSAYARPSPRPAPVTTTARPSRSSIWSSLRRKIEGDVHSGDELVVADGHDELEDAGERQQRDRLPERLVGDAVVGQELAGERVGDLRLVADQGRVAGGQGLDGHIGYSGGAGERLVGGPLDRASAVARDHEYRQLPYRGRQPGLVPDRDADAFLRGADDGAEEHGAVGAAEHSVVARDREERRVLTPGTFGDPLMELALLRGELLFRQPGQPGVAGIAHALTAARPG